VLVIVCYVLMYSGGCSVVMPWWVVGEGNVVNVQCYYRVCETAGHHNPPYELTNETTAVSLHRHW